MALSVSTPAAKQKRSKLADTSSKALPTGPLGVAVVFVLNLFMALLSFRGISTPSLPAQGEQRRSFYFNIRRDIPPHLRMHQLFFRVKLLAQGQESKEDC